MIQLSFMRWLGDGLRRAQTPPDKRSYGGSEPLQLVRQRGTGEM